MLDLSHVKTLTSNYQADVAQLGVKSIRLLKKVLEIEFEKFFERDADIDAVRWSVQDGSVDAQKKTENPLDSGTTEWYAYDVWQSPVAAELVGAFDIRTVFVTNYEHQVVVQFFDQKGRRLP